MRDPAHINTMLDLLRRYWIAHPDLRLGQIVGNFTPPAGFSISEGSIPGDSYLVEDSVIESRLRAALKEG